MAAFIVWAVARANGFALRLVTTGGGVYAPLLSKFVNRMRSSLYITTEIAELCLHACFLHHAMNEQQGYAPGERRSFLEIVQWLAENRAAVRAWIHQSA